MRLLFDLGHPAHFHLFKNTIAELRAGGHDVVIFAREKDCLPQLLDKAGWSYYMPRRRRGGQLRLGLEAIGVFARAVAIGLTRPFDLMIGTSFVIGPASRVTGATSLVFSENDAAHVPLFVKLAYTSGHYVVTPRCLQSDLNRAKHLTYKGYQELAYLHPNRFRPDPGVRAELGLGEGDKYFLIRKAAYTAFHDVGHAGLAGEQLQMLIDRLAQHGRVFLSIEGELPRELRSCRLPTPVDRMLDVLAFADMVVADSATVTIEAAVLGTPAAWCSTFVGHLAILGELEHDYGLIAGYRPEDFDGLVARIDEWLMMPNLKDRWQEKRSGMLAECIDLTAWILDLLGRLDPRHKATREREHLG